MKRNSMMLRLMALIALCIAFLPGCQGLTRSPEAAVASVPIPTRVQENDIREAALRYLLSSRVPESIGARCISLGLDKQDPPAEFMVRFSQGPWVVLPESRHEEVLWDVLFAGDAVVHFNVSRGYWINDNRAMLHAERTLQDAKGQRTQHLVLFLQRTADNRWMVEDEAILSEQNIRWGGGVSAYSTLTLPYETNRPFQSDSL